MRKVSSCLIVGAGISGLLAAKSLSEQGVKVILLEKGRGVGGRMATRRLGDAVFDHGAQFLTGTSARFGALLKGWHQRGLLTPWAEGFADTTGGFFSPGVKCFRGNPGMTAVPKYLASSMKPHLENRVLRAEITPAGWRVMTDLGIEFSAEALILTTPVPQALDLLSGKATTELLNDLSPLRRVHYNSSVAVMIRLEGPSGVPPPGALYLINPVVSWIADNHQKGISPERAALTVHTTPDYSHVHIDDPESEIIGHVREEIGRFLGSRILDMKIHRWRYSQPATCHPEPNFLGCSDPPLLFAGDGFGSGRVEGAALSGLSAAQRLLSLLT